MTIVSKVCKSTAAGSALPTEFKSILIKEIKLGSLFACLVDYTGNVPSLEKQTCSIYLEIFIVGTH